MKLFEMKHIKKSFGALDVLRDISLEVDQGEVLSIIGPSGSGKSTLLRCATGLEIPDSGETSKMEKSAWYSRTSIFSPIFPSSKILLTPPLKSRNETKKKSTPRQESF